MTHFLRRVSVVIFSTLIMMALLASVPSQVRAAVENWSFETLPTDGGWQIAVEEGSEHVEGDCTSHWLELEPVEGSCFVQFTQDSPTAFALYHEIPGGGYVVIRHLDTEFIFNLAVDQVTYNEGALQITYASENLDGRILDNGDNKWSLGDGGQKMAIYELSAEPDDWFDIDPSLVTSILASPTEMEVDSDGVVGDGDTDGEWVTIHLLLGGSDDPSISMIGSTRLVGSTTEFANDRVRWVWLRCIREGDAGSSRRLPLGCRTVSRGAGLGSSLERRAYRLSAADRRSGYMRVAIYADGEWHYSSALSVR